MFENTTCCLQKWQELLDLNDPKRIDRLSFRWMALDSGLVFGELVKRLHETGDFDPRLETEMQEANQAATHEAPGEELHAKICHVNAQSGRDLDPPSVNGRTMLTELLVDFGTYCSS